MPRDAGRMVSKLTADDRPVFAHRWMVRASDFGPHQFIRGVCPMHSLAANSSASGARRCRLSAPLRRAGWLGAGCAHIVKSLQAGPGRLPSSKR